MMESRLPGDIQQKESSPNEILIPTVSYVTLAQALQVEVDTLHGWVRQGRIPSPTYFGKHARWPLDVAKQIIAEGTKPAGTYVPSQSYQSQRSKKLPPTITASLGHQTKTDGKMKRQKKTPKQAPTAKRRKPCPKE